MMGDQANSPDPEALGDETIVVNAGQGAARVASAPAQVDDVASDETIVVTSDETVVVTSEQTVVVTSYQARSAPVDDAIPTGDETIVVVADATVVVPAGKPQSRRDRRLAEQSSLRDSLGSNAAPAIEENRQGRGLQHGAGAGLDLDRPIAPVPGSMPWDEQPAGERGLSQGLPVSYGARLQTETLLQTGVDEAQRIVGPAPAATPVHVLTGREQLPSLHRKDRRRKRTTLAVYGGVVVACVAGLWGVATIAFG